MARHHPHERILITKYGEMRLDVPVFRCGDCGANNWLARCYRQRASAKAVFQKIRDEAMRLAAQGIRYERVGKIAWVSQKHAMQVAETGEIHTPQVVGRDIGTRRAWTRVAGGNVELKVARDERGVALASAGSWKDALTAARDMGASAPRHIVNDGDRAIESAIDMAHGKGDPHQLRQFHLLLVYTRS